MKKQDKRSRILNLGFRDGYMTAFAQLETYLIQTYVNKILGIKDPKEFMNVSDEDYTKVMDVKIPLGVFLASINRIREQVNKIMAAPAEKSESETPANEDANRLDGGMQLG